MLIVYLFIAIAAYVGLYFASDFIAGHLDTPKAWMESLNQLIIMPSSQLFQVARLLLLLFAVYVVFDFIKSTSKRAFKKKPPPEKMELKSTVSEKANH